MPAGICEIVRENHGNKFAGRSRDDSTLAKYWKKSLNGQATVVSGHATVGRLSNNVFSTFQAIRFRKKSLNGHATVVGGHATVGWLSNNVFLTFQAIRKIFEKSHWRSRDSGRRSRDRWMTVKQRFLEVSSNSEIFWKKSLKVTRQWSEVTRPLDDCQTTFLDVSSNSEKFWKKSLKVTRQWSEVTRPLDDCQTTFFDVSSNSEKFLKKVTERSRDSGRRSRDRWMTVKQRFLTFQAIRKIFEKSHWRSRDSGRRSRDRWMTVKQRFLTFQAIRKIFEKSHWTVTRQWSEVTRPLADCQTTFFRRFKQFEKFWKKSLNGHATVVGGHATVGWLSNNVFCMNKREREGEKRETEGLRYTSYGHATMLCKRWTFHQPASRLRLALTRVVDRQGQLVYEYCKSSHWQVEFMLCAICRSTFTRQFSRVLTPVSSNLEKISRESPAKDMWCHVAEMGNLFPS